MVLRRLHTARPLPGPLSPTYVLRGASSVLRKVRAEEGLRAFASARLVDVPFIRRTTFLQELRVPAAVGSFSVEAVQAEQSGVPPIGRLGGPA